MNSLRPESQQLLTEIRQRQIARECFEAEFWSKVKIDIFCEMDNELPGWSKMSANAEVVNKIQQHLQKNLDFALTNDDGGYVYFFNDLVLMSYHPKKGEQNAIIKLKPDVFISSLKLALLGHPQFVPNNALQFNKVYKKITCQTT